MSDNPGRDSLSTASRMSKIGSAHLTFEGAFASRPASSLGTVPKREEHPGHPTRHISDALSALWRSSTACRTQGPDRRYLGGGTGCWPTRVLFAAPSSSPGSRAGSRFLIVVCPLGTSARRRGAALWVSQRSSATPPSSYGAVSGGAKRPTLQQRRGVDSPARD